MKIDKLSVRMQALARLVSQGNRLCDVGTDHGYLPIALVTEGKVPFALAMDLRQGPLDRAKEHIQEEGLEDRILTRLSDGVAGLGPGEADTILIAGMGGEIILHILREGKEICSGVKELILQPQSQIGQVRAYLRENGYQIVAEDMVLEDGKFYPMMRVLPERDSERNETACETKLWNRHLLGADLPEAELEAVEDLYGPLLLRDKHPVLLAYLKKEANTLKEIKDQLQKQPLSHKIGQRLAELEVEIERNALGLSLF